jgi:hypothetical protein
VEPTSFCGFRVSTACKMQTRVLDLRALQNKLKSKAPFSQYSELERYHGVQVVWGSPTDPFTWPQVCAAKWQPGVSKHA